MNRRNAFTTVLILSIAVLIVLGTAQQAPAQKHHGCTNATLDGDYAVHFTGNVLSGQFAGPIAFVGLFTFDGQGGLKGDITLRRNDSGGPTTSTANYLGSYTVNANCTFEDIWNNLAGGIAIHEATITDHGAGFVILNTSAGPTVVSGEGRRVDGDGKD
jgi:hypothetical protein